MKPIKLKYRYMTGICCLIICVSAALLLFMRHKFIQRMERELHKRGETIARNLAISSVKPILTENRIALQLLVNETKNIEEDLRYIYVVTPHGEILAHTFGRTFPHDLLKLDIPLPPSKKALIQPIKTESEQLEDISVPIHGSDFGRIHVGLSEDAIKMELHNVVIHGLPIVGLILFIGITGSWWFAFKITAPLAKLSESVRKVGSGDFDGSIHIKSHDEIGELSNAFNTMLRQLRELQIEQQQAHDHLSRQAAILAEEVTERQQAQEALAVKQTQLESLNQLLEERVHTAVSELRLKDKIMLAQGRQAAMGEMINNIAHQWRQPLNNLGLIIQGIQSDHEYGSLTSEVMADQSSKAMKTILFMSQTINDFSTFFRSDKTRTTFSAVHGIKKVIAMLEASLSKQGITIQIEVIEDVLIDGYFNEYNQVVLNLLNNAKDILAERLPAAPRITITVTKVTNSAVVTVWDNGGGIPESIIDKIFEPYFSTKEDGKGSGVGLYMSKIIIQEHFGGTLTVRNCNDGAEFTITTSSVEEQG